MLESLLWLIAIFVISAIPLNMAVKILSGHSTLLRVVIVNIVAAIVTFGLNLYFPWYGSIFSFLALLFIYSVMFDLSYFRAFLAWILQFVIIAVLWVAVVYLFSINVI